MGLSWIYNEQMSACSDAIRGHADPAGVFKGFAEYTILAVRSTDVLIRRKQRAERCWAVAQDLDIFEAPAVLRGQT